MAIVYRNTDLTRWGTGKGARLTSLEGDLNLWQITQRVTELENNPILPVELEAIDVTGNLMTFLMSDYSTRGPITLPQAAFNFTGDFQPLHNYELYDFLLARDGLYLVLTPYTSGATFAFGPSLQLIMPFPKVFDIGFFFPGKPGRGIDIDDYEAAAMWSYRAARQFYLPADLVGSVGGLFIQAEDDCFYPIMQNLDQIGEISIAAGNVTCNFTFADNIQFEIDDVLRVLRPVTLDGTAKDLTCTLKGAIGLIP
jgi:hypothetical protein